MADPIVIERLLDTTPDETFALLTEPERLRRWQTISAAVDLRVGGAYRFTVTPGNVATGEVLEVDPGKRLVFSWGWAGSDEVPPGSSTLLVEMEPVGQQTRVRFTHDGLDEIWAARHEEGWDHYADRLVALAAGNDPGFDQWMSAPEELDHLTAAEAGWALCRQQLLTLTPDDQNLPTPCSEFTIHELVVHLQGSVNFAGSTAGGQPQDGADSKTAEDFVAVAVESALAAWRARGVDGEVPFGEGTVPAMVPPTILNLEFLVHAWDLAQAQGAPFEAPEGLCQFVLNASQPVIADDNRGPGKGFGPALEPSADDALSELLAFTGRKVG